MKLFAQVEVIKKILNGLNVEIAKRTVKYYDTPVFLRDVNLKETIAQLKIEKVKFEEILSMKLAEVGEVSFWGKLKWRLVSWIMNSGV